jgi:hypothetical protein
MIRRSSIERTSPIHRQPVCSLCLCVSVVQLLVLWGCRAAPRAGRDHACGPQQSETSELREPVRFALGDAATVFVPAHAVDGDKAVDLLVHSHGAPQVVEREFTAAGFPGVLIVVNFHGLSSAYERPFSEPDRFGDLLKQALRALRERSAVPAQAGWGRVRLSSFSAGYGAVRALLRQPRWFQRIEGIYLADSLYAGYMDADNDRTVNPQHTAPFRRFAEQAAAGLKTLVVTHSYLAPGAYAGTHETADDLIAFVGARREAVDEPGPGPLRIISKVDAGNFIVRGCRGDTGEDHGDHLRNLRFGLGMLKEASSRTAEGAEVADQP